MSLILWDLGHLSDDRAAREQYTEELRRLEYGREGPGFLDAVLRRDRAADGEGFLARIRRWFGGGPRTPGLGPGPRARALAGSR